MDNPDFEKSVIRKDLIPLWMKKLLMVFILYKAYCLLRSSLLLLAVHKGGIQPANGQTAVLFSLMALDLLEMLVYIALQNQWKPAVTAGIGIIIMSLLRTFFVFADDMNHHVYSSASMLFLGIMTLLVPAALMTAMLVRLFKIRRAWHHAVAGK